MSDTNTADSLAGGVNVAPSDGTAAVSEDVVSFKDLINQELGKSFDSDEAALKAVKDTFSYIGDYGKVRPVIKQLQAKYGEDFIPKMEQAINSGQPTDTSKFVTKDDLDSFRFYSANKDLEPHKAVIEALVSTTGKSRAEVVAMENVKELFTKAKAYEEVEKTKSVLQTHTRLGVAADNVTKSREALGKGDHAAAEKAAMDAVAEAYNLK